MLHLTHVSDKNRPQLIVWFPQLLDHICCFFAFMWWCERKPGLKSISKIVQLHVWCRPFVPTCFRQISIHSVFCRLDTLTEVLKHYSSSIEALKARRVKNEMSGKINKNGSHNNNDIYTCKIVCQMIWMPGFCTEPKRSRRNHKNSERPWRNKNRSGKPPCVWCGIYLYAAFWVV